MELSSIPSKIRDEIIHDLEYGWLSHEIDLRYYRKQQLISTDDATQQFVGNKLKELEFAQKYLAEKKAIVEALYGSQPDPKAKKSD